MVYDIYKIIRRGGNTVYIERVTKKQSIVYDKTMDVNIYIN
jgi:hypothetical protein